MVFGAILATGASLTASVLVVQVAILPLVFKYSKLVQRKIVFSNCINFPPHMDYENPSSVDIIGGRNFYIEFESKVDNHPMKLGVWHMIPCSMFKEVFVIRNYLEVDKCLYNELKSSQNPIILYLHAISQQVSKRLLHETRHNHNVILLYCHGNSNHRASPHRLSLYKIFQELNFHVITFDYRGYGDSSQIKPTEKGVVEDALEVYRWLQESLISERKPTVVIWGHSLGSAVAANLVSNLEELCKAQGKKCLPQPDALVLEAPFNNLVNEIESHPFSKLVSWLPYYQASFVKPFEGCKEYAFTTDQYLTKVPQLPILMLHSISDRIVPYELAVKLHTAIVESRAEGGAPIVFHTFDKCRHLGHNNLCEAKELKGVITNFLDVLKDRTKKEETSNRINAKSTVISQKLEAVLNFPNNYITETKQLGPTTA